MLSQVVCVVGLLVESFATDVAAELELAGVDLLVSHQYVSACVPFLALVTRKSVPKLSVSFDFLLHQKKKTQTFPENLVLSNI